MTHFLFITHITPAAKRSSLRQSLIDAQRRSLNEQSWPHWTSVVLGEEDGSDGKFEYFRLPEGTTEERHCRLKEMLNGPRFTGLADKVKYIVKLDDDDLISPQLLEKTASLDFDLYYDDFHTFLDISSGIITQQQRSWVASTCIHRKEHAFSSWNGPGASVVGNLLYTDHSKSWHLYYRDKKKITAPAAHPVYLRILSPTSITSGAKGGPVRSMADVSMEKYFQYLRGFGNWKHAGVTDFDAYLGDIAKAWEVFSGKPQHPLKNMGASGWRKIIGKIRPR